jgi:ribosomal protein S17E
MTSILKLAAAQVAAISLCALATRWFLRPNMTLLDGILYVAGFTVAGLVTVHLFKRRRLPASLLRVLDMMHAAVREVSAKGLMRGAARFVGAYPTLFTSVILVMLLQHYAPAVETLPDGACGVYNAATVIGILGLVLGALWGIIGDAANVVSFAVTVIERSVLLSLGLVLVRVFGADVAASLAWVKGNPDAALAAGAGIIVVRMMFALVPDRTYLVARGAEGRLGYAQAVVRPKRARTANDIYRTAAHEAGHLLLFADLPELPAQLTVNVMEALGHQDEYRGYVRHSDEFVPEVLTESYMRWLMLMNLAGSEGEFAMLGDREDGAVADNQIWLKVATFYISAGFGEVFYVDPVGDAQQAHNRAVLNALKVQHLAELTARFATNKAVLAELAAAIAEKKAMTREEIAPYLSRVV